MPDLQFTATYITEGTSSIEYTLAGINGAPTPPAVYVSETSAFTYNNVTGQLTVFGLENSTDYIFTITAAGYDSVTTTSQITRSKQTLRFTPPEIYGQPANQIRAAGAPTMFAVATNGSCQWYKNGVEISGATSGTYMSSTSADGDTYYAIATNIYGSTTSSTATFTLAYSPQIVSQPQNATSVAGQTANFNVSATGTLPLTYQWQRNGTNITGATSANLLTVGSNGDVFRVIISNYAGSTTSDEVTLTVTGTTVSSESPICFLADAPVLTPLGYRRIADLRVGDMICTADGRRVPVQVVKVMTCEPSEHTNPYIIPRGKYGARKNLHISPRHRVAVGGGRMVEARHLGLEQAKMESTITYYNLGLPNWGRDNIVVAGVTVESLAPVTRRAVSLADFTRIVLHKHGARLTSEKIAEISRACRMLPDGRVEVPYIKRN